MATEETKKDEEISEEVEEQTEQEAAQDAVDPKDAEIESLKEQVAKLTEEVASTKDLMLRRQADLDNMRKRLLRDKDEAVLYANTKLIEDLLPSLDDFSRAIASADASDDFNALKEGVVMMEKQLLSTLEKNWGLKKIDCLNKEFDPQEHEACMMVESPDVEVETVLMELQAGYKLHDRVIRPAKVQVGKPV